MSVGTVTSLQAGDRKTVLIPVRVRGFFVFRKTALKMEAPGIRERNVTLLIPADC
jgi:hypothetical protein